MPVKDLVRHFESSSVSPEGPPRTALGAASSPTSNPDGQPPRSPARFVHHPLLKRPLPPSHTSHSPTKPRTAIHAREAAEERSSVLRLYPATSAVGPNVSSQHDAPIPKLVDMVDHQRNHHSPTQAIVVSEKTEVSANSAGIPVVASQLDAPALQLGGGLSSILGKTQTSKDGLENNIGQRDHSRPQDKVLSLASTPSQANHTFAKRVGSIILAQPATETSSSLKPSISTTSRGQKSRVFNDIPMNTLSRDTHVHHDLTTSRSQSPSATLVSHRRFTPHVPIAAKTVFSRGSAPLLLPPLDDYLSLLPPPTFSSFPSRIPTAGSPDSVMFPPFDRLSVTGRTIEDLENNATIVPPWRNKGSIFGSLANLITGLLGSSAIASYYSLEGLYDGFQLLALLLSTIVPHSSIDVSDKWRKLFLGTIPNVLALNLSTTVLESFVLLVIFMAFSGLLLYYFHVSTTRISLESLREGFQGKDTGAGWGILFASFTLTLIYLPLSTIAVHAILWSQDFWVVPNPYTNATTFPPVLPPLGPPSQFRDPLDFCYTTTMNKNEINFAPVIVILSTLTFIFLTVWFPIRLVQVIRPAVPCVDRYTELGTRRSRVEMNLEYERLLERDKNPFYFLYKDFRMQWGAYKAFYLLVKLSTLLIVAFLSPDNCVFRNANSKTVSIVREAILVFAMLAFLLVQSFLTPFLDPVDNASEWASRVGYVTFAILGLAVALDLPDAIKNALNGPVLYVVYAINYGLTIYFLLIDTSLGHRIVKRLSRRIDFSIDIFSPHLDISDTSRHTRRRIWQETISALLLTTPDCAIPKTQRMEFSEPKGSHWPPYLLGFQRTPAERHVENLKILREMGGLAYAKGVALHTGQCSERLKRVQERIQRHFIGPDSFWRMPSESGNNEDSFGNAWWIPFPPTLVIRYDTGRLAVLDRLQDFEEYVSQNGDTVIQEKRNIRMALRALDGAVVSWPYTHTKLIGSRVSWCCGRQYTAQITNDYHSCVLSITRRGSLPWKGIQLGSGFDVQLTYARDVQVDGDVIGLDTDFDMTPQLAKFFELNKELINYRLPRIDAAIYDYRRQTRRDIKSKLDVLTYEFLCTVYGSPKDPHRLAKVIMEQEKDLRARQAFVEHEDALKIADERMTAVNRTEATTWWYLYWDDLWRRNYDTISALNTHATDFNPHYPTSIAYRPLPRPALETFLTQRGLFNKNGGWANVIHSGVLNKLYFRLNQIVFRGSDNAIPIHIGDASLEVDIEDLEFSSHPKTSSLGTGGGTDHDDVSIRARPFYRWEAIYGDPLQHGPVGRHKRWLPKLSAWLGLTPFWKTGKFLTNGVSLDVRLEDGKYVLLEHVVNELKDKVD